MPSPIASRRLSWLRLKVFPSLSLSFHAELRGLLLTWYAWRRPRALSEGTMEVQSGWRAMAVIQTS